MNGYVVRCKEPGCTWARTYMGEEVVPPIPHAAHYMETGHDFVNQALTHDGGEAPAFTEAEWTAAKTFSAGWKYGMVYAARAIRAKVLEALPPEDRLKL